MKALITGITGQDGQILTERLLAEGTEVHGTLLHADRLAGTLFPGQVQLHVCDLRDFETISQIVQQVEPDEIYNLAGISSVAYSWQHPTLTGLISGLGAVAVMEAARQLQQRLGRPVRVLQASSSEIFGSPAVSPQTENTPICPTSPYGTAKAYAHQQAGVLRADGLPVSCAILYNHESRLRPQTFVTRKITSGVARIVRKQGGTLSLGNLDVRRDWGWAPDYVEAMVLAIRHPEPDDYVIATGQAHSVRDFLATAFARVGISDWQDYVEVDPQFFRPVDPALQVGDATKAHQVLGWYPTVGFTELVNRMVDYDVALGDSAL